MMGAGLTSPIRGRIRPAATVRILGIAMVLAAVRSATDTIGRARPEWRCVEPWVTGSVDRAAVALHQSHGSAVVGCLPRVIRTRPR